MLEIDILDVESFIEENKKIYTDLENIFNALLWRIYKSKESYYNNKLDVYIIKSDGSNSDIFVSLVIKFFEDLNIKKIICVMIEEKNTGKRIISEIKK